MRKGCPLEKRLKMYGTPTGAGFFVDVPVWAMDVALFVATAVAFGFFGKSKLVRQNCGRAPL